VKAVNELSCQHEAALNTAIYCSIITSELLLTEAELLLLVYSLPPSPPPQPIQYWVSGHWDPNLAATDQKNGPSPPPPPPPAPGGFVDATNRHDDPPRHQHVDANDTRTKTPPNNMKMA
jgi:hypothetical protein